MATYGPLDEVTDHGKQFTTYDFTTGTNVLYNFVTAGYTLGDVLNDPTQGQVQLYGYDQSGNTITVKVGGVDTPLDGTAFMILDTVTNTDAYFVYNLPDEQNQVYTFKAVFSLNGADQMSVVWNNQTSA